MSHLTQDFSQIIGVQNFIKVGHMYLGFKATSHMDEFQLLKQ